jgi:hypothetical protein
MLVESLSKKRIESLENTLMPIISRSFSEFFLIVNPLEALRKKNMNYKLTITLLNYSKTNLSL